MHILALVLSVLFACAHSRMLLGSSEDRRTFYHSIRDIILVEDVDLATGFKYGECSHLVKGKVVRVSFFAGRFYPHYEVTGGDVGYLSDEAAYKACIEDYKNLKFDVLYDVGLTALALADFAKELGMTRDLNAVPALEFVINIAKRNIDRSDGKRLAYVNPKFVDENLKYGTGNSEDVRFSRPVETIHKEPKDFISRPVDDVYFGTKDFKNEKSERFGTPPDRPSGNYFAEVRLPQRDRVEAGGRDSPRDRVEDGGRDLPRDAGVRPAGSREPLRNFLSTESDPTIQSKKTSMAEKCTLKKQTQKSGHPHPTKAPTAVNAVTPADPVILVTNAPARALDIGHRGGPLNASDHHEHPRKPRDYSRPSSSGCDSLQMDKTTILKWNWQGLGNKKD